MKKLSIVAALALVTTVGGVYAAWNYPTSGAAGWNQTTANGVKITATQSSGVYGTINVLSSTLNLSIDDVGSVSDADDIADYTPGWNPANVGDTGHLQITYTAKEGAPSKVKLKYSISISGNSYDHDNNAGTPAVNILNLKSNDATYIVKETEVEVSTTVGSAVEAANISYTKFITDLLEVNDDFTVPTHADYLRYKTAIENIKITVKVDDITGETVLNN